MLPLYPLRFRPVFKQYLWGGRRLGTVLRKPVNPAEDYAESWEISDHPSGQSIVADGPLQGTSLRQLMEERSAELLGEGLVFDRFPLLFKFLDCQRVLSVQVHPNDAQGAKLNPPDLGKTEAWLVLAAEPGALVYAGLKRGFDRPALTREVARGTTELCLHQFEPRVGDCIFIPAGTVHALGAGLLVAEIQQASDTTFRLFDWNRVDAEGKSRPLHVAESLTTIDYEMGPVTPQTPLPTDRAGCERLVQCDKFVLDRWTIEKATEMELQTNKRFHLLVVLRGSVSVGGDCADRPLVAGELRLLPACQPSYLLSIAAGTQLLDIYLP